MNSLARMLDVLSIFDASDPVLTADEIIQRLEYSRPTAYRYLRELCAAGLLSRFASGYTLGPRVIELDYVIRLADPVLNVAKAPMHELAEQYGCEVVLLSMYGAKVVTVHEEKSSDAPRVSFGRGHPMPLFRGAGSKVMMAYLPAAKQKKLFLQHPVEAAASTLGTDWTKFHASLRKIRSAGYDVSKGELDATNVGVGAPIFRSGQNVRESIALIMSKSRYQISDKTLLFETLKKTADSISEKIPEPKK